ncbi:MAG: sulfatase-like hydrolase/transferase [Akkermansiaceae bacterium]|nr:sulfatase-like hydrolase/transferase [Verrucomicrobiales bacterium]
MTKVPPAPVQSWKNSRYGFVAFLAGSLVLGMTLLRVVIFLKFTRQSDVTGGEIARAFLIGLHQDCVVALFASLPLLFWFWIKRERSFGKRWHATLLIIGSFMFWAVQVFLLFTEYYFFEEFRSRFNTVAVDYLLYPDEVVGNIRESYPLFTILAICGTVALAWVLAAFWTFRGMWSQSVPSRSRFLRFAGATALAAALLFTVQPEGTRFSRDRTLNEMANNGSISFVNAAITRNLEYAAHFRTLPRDEAYARTKTILASPNAEFVGDQYSLRRKILGDSAQPKLNVILVLEEALGSEFWGCLGRTNTLTPEMDKLATEEGWLFTHIYASGNRTVRGFEGVFSSFPPLPGDSIVKRDRSENVESMASVLKRDGYNTLFLYGGRGLFDGMRAYAVQNGWDRFIEQKDFENPAFTTIWGVSDEDLFGKSIEEFRKLNETGQPFFGTLLTVSNHKPYTYPPGRIPDDPEKPRPSRSKVVKYTDWALGQFFKAAKKEAFWTNTIFVVVADHGARVYGAQEVPIFSYEIPLVILGPAVVKEPRRIATLGNSLDVAPTILGVLGRPYETLFFGRDLFNDPPEHTHALLNHNRSIGMYADARMVILGLQKSVRYYDGDPKLTKLKPIDSPTPEFLELEKDATALYQVADELYMERRYRIDGVPASTQSVAQPHASTPTAKPGAN